MSAKPVPEELAEIDTTPLIDTEILQQLQEMDDDEVEREFSRSIVDEFREQVPEQLAIMKKHLDDADYLQVSQVAHFLKGSSAALGVAKVAALFELMQVKAKDISLTVESATLKAASSASPSFSPTASSLSPEQTSTLSSAKESALAQEKATVYLMQCAFERVKKEYTIAEDWLKEEYPDLDSEDEEDD